MVEERDHVASKYKSTGNPPHLKHHVEVVDRPLSLQWITDELLAETILVWSEVYGREIREDEAVEILVNVKRFAEVLLRIK